MDLLDGPETDELCLTQYINVLRLMDAPKDQVARKFLASHRRRCEKMLADEVSAARAAAEATAEAEAAATAAAVAAAAGAPGTSSAKGLLRGDTSAAAETERKAVELRKQSDPLVRARQFHQSFMVGLVEAAQGIKHLFQVRYHVEYFTIFHNISQYGTHGKRDIVSCCFFASA
jgi:hypothetical protein